MIFLWFFIPVPAERATKANTDLLDILSFHNQLCIFYKGSSSALCRPNIYELTWAKIEHYVP